MSTGEQTDKYPTCTLIARCTGINIRGAIMKFNGEVFGKRVTRIVVQNLEDFDLVKKDLVIQLTEVRFVLNEFNYTTKEEKYDLLAMAKKIKQL